MPLKPEAERLLHGGRFAFREFTCFRLPTDVLRHGAPCLKRWCSRVRLHPGGRHGRSTGRTPNLVSPDGAPGTEPLTAQRRGNPEAGSVARPLTRFQVPGRRRHPLPGFMQLCGPKGGKPGLRLDQTRAG